MRQVGLGGRRRTRRRWLIGGGQPLLVGPVRVVLADGLELLAAEGAVLVA